MWSNSKWVTGYGLRVTGASQLCHAFDSKTTRTLDSIEIKVAWVSDPHKKAATIDVHWT